MSVNNEFRNVCTHEVDMLYSFTQVSKYSGLNDGRSCGFRAAPVPAEIDAVFSQIVLLLISLRI